MRLIGLDIGTTGCKASVFDADGALVSSASREYAIDIPQPGWAEQDAEAVWRLAQEALRQAIAAAGGRGIGAIGLSAQGEAVMPVDAAGRALRPAILGMDTRTGEQNAWLRERLGAERLFQLTGMPVHTINTLPKLLWLREHEPRTWAAAERFLLYEDLIIQKMTGQPAVSRCLASRTQLYDLRADRWSPEILGVLELDERRLAPVLPSGTAVARMQPALAESLGLREPPLVVTGGHDQACGALGVGLTRPGLAMVSTGTAEVVEVALGSPALNDTLFGGNISCYAHVVPGLYLAMTLNHSGGLLLRWFRDTLCQAEVQRAQAEGGDAYDIILAGASPEPSRLLVLPHFAGSGTPTFDTASKGAILGLTFATTRTDLAKAILEGLTFELRLNLDLLKAGGIGIDELRAIGGGARSSLWLQLKADITGIPVVAPEVTEAASWGAALLAGAGAGCFASASEAAGEALRLRRRFAPEPGRMAAYASRYAVYRQLYPALAPISHQL
ncbi:MAG: FGGY-family carbohydrate kinase [Anaerolineae bacterium]|nr:FGGY-family carbohydrate kinase [Anaerolineae bacterium]